ncbi:MAG: fibronectin type III domain-containing protein [Clostridia bacterium]|jgi:hypothetical protein|nr:fibronectin type III domain-containing protein [Clostridia bacterium]
MFDIDKYLDDMRIKEFEPSESLVQKTKKECEKNMKPQKAQRRYHKQTSRKFGKGALIAIPAAAMLLVGVFLGAFLFGEKTDPSVVAFYTVDINPSVCVNVDENEIVQSVKSQNEDAEALLKTIDCVGLSVPEAVAKIIEAAKQAGFLDGDQKYVLIGRFGEGNEQALSDLQTLLDTKLGDLIDLLIVSGSLEDKLNADGLHVSAGLLILSQMADGVEITGDDKVADVVDEVNNTNQEKYLAPTLEAGANSEGVVLEWNELDFQKMGYTGKVSYHIMASNSELGIKNFDAVKIGKLDFMSTDDQPTRYFIDVEKCGVNGEKYKYYGIYAVYSGDIYVQSNVVKAIVPGPEESPKPSPSTSPEPSETPAPEPAEGLVSGYVDGEFVKLSWEKNSKDGFTGYKIVASKTNENPSYPEDGYLKYITNEGTTSKSLYEGYGGLKANTYYYFSVTYLYSDGSKIIGNAVWLKVPEKEEEPDPTDPPSGDMVATTIRGEMDGSAVYVSWDKIEHDHFAGYKVVYSYLDSTPVYGESNVYYTYITDPNVNSKVYSDITALKDYSSGATCYFSVTVLYNDPSTKVAGNVISFVAPESVPYPSTNISVSLSGNNVATSWTEITDERLQGYKVVASFTDSSPSYPENGYATWITDTTVTGYTILESYIKSLDGYEPGATCYFAITAVYDGKKVTGDADSLVYP